MNINMYGIPYELVVAPLGLFRMSSRVREWLATTNSVEKWELGG